MSEAVEQLFASIGKLDLCRRGLFANSTISPKFLLKHFTLGEEDCSALAGNYGLTPEFFEEFFSENPSLIRHFQQLSSRSDFPEEFFERYPATVNWSILCANPSITQAFFERYLNNLYRCPWFVWENLIRNPNLSWHFFERFFSDDRCLSYEKNLKKIALDFSNCKVAPWSFVRSLLQRFEIPRYEWLSSRSIPLEEVKEMVREMRAKNRLALDGRPFPYLDVAQNTNIPVSYVVGELMPLYGEGPQLEMYSELACRPDVSWDTIKHINFNQRVSSILLRRRIPPKRDVLGKMKFFTGDTGYFWIGQVVANYKLTDDEGDMIIRQLKNRGVVGCFYLYTLFCKNLGLTENFFEKHIQIFLDALSSEYYAELRRGLSSNPNIPVKFFQRHPELIDCVSLSKNPFTRQLEIESGFAEETLVRHGQMAVRGLDPHSLPSLVVNIIRQNVRR